MIVRKQYPLIHKIAINLQWDNLACYIAIKGLAMGWTMMKKNTSFSNPLKHNEVSIIASKIRNYIGYRINVLSERFPEGLDEICILMDLDKKRIGFFKDGPKGSLRKISNYGQNCKLVYVSVAKSVILSLGFEVGRYKILRKKDDPNLLFYISVHKKVKEPSSEEGNKDQEGKT